MRRLVADLDDAIKLARRIAMGLAVVEVGEHGLGRSLAHMAEDVRKTYGTSCMVRVRDDDPRLDEKVAVHLYHIAKEAVNNAIIHGNARRVMIRVERLGEKCRLTVWNDGIALPCEPGSGGLGLEIMRTRAALIGGTLSLLSDPEGGVTLMCDFPAARTEGAA